MAQKYKQYVLGTPSIYYTEIPVQSVENSQDFSFRTDGIHYLQKIQIIWQVPHSGLKMKKS